MLSASHIRTMMFIAENTYRRETVSIYRILDSERNDTFGFIRGSFIKYGYKTIPDCIAAFREAVDFMRVFKDDAEKKVETELEDDFDVSSII